ncbi:Aste57867_16041 [Aphanomyces stellatus]|uniref:Aste57867_16041 protein n=1 Tax=Aphanomyces stellatus TaxID=120398 RepID=A0A485L4Q1_9STRA|nr:hypothetical protein As57867_015985 [Aphanomyces stellatus]VFT92825.1 Aste57867_16041 [Aphanomyces stellatus]
MLTKCRALLGLYFLLVDATAKVYRISATALQTSATLGSFPSLPSVLTQGETLSNMAITLPASGRVSFTVVATVNASHSFTFTPSMVDCSSVATQTFSLAVGGGGNTTGTYTIQFMVAGTNQTLFSSAVTVVPPPVAFAVTDPRWSGNVLAYDNFDNLPFGSIPNASTSIWQYVEHGFSSTACGKVGANGSALYFTHMGNRLAATNAFDLRGLDAQISFAYIYGYLPTDTYDAVGNNTLSCEKVDRGAEVNVEVSVDNNTTWQNLLFVPLPSTPVHTMQATSIALPPLARLASFRWIQHNQSSGRVGTIRGTRYQWQYRNLWDQWAIDNVQVTVRVRPPTIVTTTTLGLDSLTVLLTAAPATNSFVVTSVGDGSHPFPVCNFTAPPSGTNATVTLSTTGIVHAVACVTTSAQQSYGMRSPRFYIQALPPQLVVTRTNQSAYTVAVTMPRPNMVLWFTFGDGSRTPSCTFGSFVAVATTTTTLQVTSNGILRAVACGTGLVGSDVVTPPPFVVQPSPPTIALVNAVNVTTTTQFNVTATSLDVDSTVAVAVTTTATLVVPTCATANSGAATSTWTLQPSQRLAAVSCCGTTYCDDSVVTAFGPVVATTAMPTIATACSTTAMATAVVTLAPGTTTGVVKYAINSNAIDCTSATLTYTAPLTVANSGNAAVTAPLTVRAITCVDGLLPSDVLVATVPVSTCCANALTFPSASPSLPCASVLVFRDDFATCATTLTNQWTASTTQFGGVNVNGGVHVTNVQCATDVSTGTTVLSLGAHGDGYTGTTPLGVALASDGSATARNASTPLNAWAVPGIRSFPCNPNAATCAARRVGASVSTIATFNAGVASFRMKACPMFGAMSEMWMLDLAGVASAIAASSSSSSPYADLWRASLQHARTAPYVHYVHGSSVTDGMFHRYYVQWNRTEGRANIYRDGQLVQKLRALPTSPNAAALTFQVWFPNAWAGMPTFDTCATQIGDVQVVKLEAAANRWCDWDSQPPVACSGDATCQQWVASNCLFPTATAVCTNSVCGFSLDPQFASPLVQSKAAYFE